MDPTKEAGVQIPQGAEGGEKEMEVEDGAVDGGGVGADDGGGEGEVALVLLKLRKGEQIII